MNDNKAENNSNRIPVPRDELDLALNCIDETVSNRIEKYIDVPREQRKEELPQIEKEKNLSLYAASESDSDSLEKSLSLLKSQILTSLHSAIEHSVVPMDEREYNKTFIKYDTPMKKCIEKAEIDEDEMSLDEDDNSNSDYDSATSMDESESEDEEDLIDKAALKRAKELRELVRKKAADTRAIQDAKISKLLKHIMTELNEWNKIDDEQSKPSDRENGNESNKDNKSEVIHKRLEKMKTSLSQLTSTLKVLDVELPDKMESLQQTSETILRYIKKIDKQKNKDADNEGGFSRVEEAIFSRVDRNRKGSMGESSHAVSGFGSLTSKLTEMNAEQRFALFVSQVDSPWGNGRY